MAAAVVVKEGWKPVDVMHRRPRQPARWPTSGDKISGWVAVVVVTVVETLATGPLWTNCRPRVGGGGRGSGEAGAQPTAATSATSRRQ